MLEIIWKKLKKSVEKHRLTGWTPQNKKWYDYKMISMRIKMNKIIKIKRKL